MSVLGKQKRFGNPTAVSASIAATMSSVAEEGGASIELVSLARITLDPDQPRRMGLPRGNPRDIPTDDARLHAELAGIEDLAESIRALGVIEPVGVYRHGNEYRLAWGERRVLACELLGMVAIRAEILPTRPRDLRAKQIAENRARHDLPLRDRIHGYRRFVEERANEGTALETAESFATATGMKPMTAYRYFALLSAPTDVAEAIENGSLVGIAEAYRIACIKDPDERAAALQAAITGAPVAEPPVVASAPAAKAAKRVGRPMTSVSFKVPNGNVVRYLVERLLDKKQFEVYRNAKWDDLRVCQDILQQVLKKLERQVSAPTENQTTVK